MISDERILEVVRRYVTLDVKKTKTRNYVRTESTLILHDRYGNEVLSASSTSLQARNQLLEIVLLDLVREAITCPDCGSSDCARKDEDACAGRQVMRA